VRGLTEALNIEFERLGVRVSAVLVSYVKTPMVVDAAVKAASVEKVGVKVAPETVAETVWKAAHGRKVLYRVGIGAVIVNLVVRLLGMQARGLYKRLGA
jgi:short-subunit dehydrogenase